MAGAFEQTIIVGGKLCTKCQNLRAYTDFNKRNASPDGLDYRCVYCRNNKHEYLYDLEGEKWRDIAGYEGLYQISNFGRLKSTRSYKKRFNGQLLKQSTNGHGYMRVTLCKDNRKKSVSIHPLVLEAFVCPRPKNYVAHHINHNKEDNRVSNLLWCTQSMNNLFAHHYHKLEYEPPRFYGEAHPQSVLTKDDVSEIRNKYIPRICPSRKLAKEYGVSKTTILNIVNNKIWKGAA